jgi:hypothetical protein
MESQGSYKNPRFRERCRALLGVFFRSLSSTKPRWVSILHPVGDGKVSCLTQLLGFEHSVGLQFLMVTGLIKKGNPKHQDAYAVLQGEWEKFAVEQNLSDIIETSATATYVNRSRHYFIHYGHKDQLYHRPIDQFNGKAPQTSSFNVLGTKQKKLHKEISSLLLSMQLDSKSYSCTWEEEVEDVVIAAEETVLLRCDVTTSKDPVYFWEECIEIDAAKTPNLSRIFEGKSKIQSNLLTALFGELASILGNGNNAVTFYHGNGRKGVALIVPVIKSQESFLEQARKKKWIENMLAHMCGSSDIDVEDAAQWLAYYLGKKHDASFTLACDALGIPLVEQMDDAGAEAMWAQANINVTQQRIIKRHLRHHFGRRVFIPEKNLSGDSEYYHVPISYGEYKYYKDDDMSQKPEKCNYWCRDSALVVSKELERLIDYTNDLDVISRFSSLCTTEGMNIIAGADQGQGAWRSWLKISTMSANEIRERMGKDVDFDPKTSYIISQVAHITCKKDHHTILSNTVSEQLSLGYEKLKTSAIVLVKLGNEEDRKKKRVKAVFVSKHARDITMENVPFHGNASVVLTYTSQSEHFSTKCVDDESFPKNSSILFVIPHFKVFLTGDLSYYADILGMPNSCSYWCPFCLLSRPEWQESALNTGEKRTAEFLEDIYERIKKDHQKKLKAMDKKGVSCAQHYKCLTPEDLVPPLLHMEIGMVNQVWDDFQTWIDNDVE